MRSLTGAKVFAGDVIFQGNAAKWKKFANSLRMVLALRLSKVDPTTGKAEFTAAYSDPAGYIATNAENAILAYTDVNQFRNPDNALFDGRNDYACERCAGEQTHHDLSDPRLPAYATPTTANVGQVCWFALWTEP